MLKRVFTAVLLFVGGSQAYALPYTTFGPDGIRSIMFDQSNVGVAWAEANFGLQKTSDGGSTWSSIPTVIPGVAFTYTPAITNITQAPSNGNVFLAQAFASTSGGFLNAGGVFRSVDNGNSWQNVLLPTTSNSWQYSGFGFDISNPNTVYTSIRQVSTGNQPEASPIDGAAVYKSSDLGATWMLLSTINNPSWNLSNSGTNRSSLAAHNGILFAGNMKSTDGGISWNPLSTNSYINNLSIKSFYIPSELENLVFATTNGGTIKSTDGGATWSYSSLGSDQSNSIIRDKDNPLKYFATGMGGRLYKSIDAGATWSLFEQLPTMIEYANLEISTSGDTLYILDGVTGGGGYALSITNTVPEPAPYAMILAGLWLIYCFSNRNRQTKPGLIN